MHFRHASTTSVGNHKGKIMIFNLTTDNHYFSFMVPNTRSRCMPVSALERNADGIRAAGVDK